MKDTTKSKKALTSELSHKKKSTKDIDGKEPVTKVVTPADIYDEYLQSNNNSNGGSKKTKKPKDNGKVKVAKQPKQPKTDATADSKAKHPKKLHLTVGNINERIAELETKIAELTGTENANKRKRNYQILAKLKLALKNPEEFTVDPTEEQKRVQEKKDKIVQKKLDKKAELQAARDEEKRKMKHKICLVCKRRGHMAETCFEKPENAQLGTICFNCGSTEHSLNYCPKERVFGQLPFATCFYCKEQGHIGRDCPTNEAGIYYKGGSCFICNSTRHLAKECDQRYQSTENRFVDNEIVEEKHPLNKIPSKKDKQLAKSNHHEKIGDEDEEMDDEEVLDDDEAADDFDEAEYDDLPYNAGDVNEDYK